MHVLAQREKAKNVETDGFGFFCFLFRQRQSNNGITAMGIAEPNENSGTGVILCMTNWVTPPIMQNCINRNQNKHDPEHYCRMIGSIVERARARRFDYRM